MISPVKLLAGAEGENSTPTLFYGVFHLFCKFANKMTLSVSA